MKLRETRIVRVGLTLSVAVLGLLLPRESRGAACVWDGSSSTNWVTAANWSGCAGPPAASDTITINSGGNQPSISTAVNVFYGQITINSGAVLTVASGGAWTLSSNITGVGNIVVASGGTLNWNQGTVDGTGTFTIQSGATLNMSSSYGTLARPLTNSGTTNISSSAYMYLTSGGTFTNNGTVNIQSNTYGFYGSGSGTPVSNGASGTITRSVNSSLAYIYNCAFSNSGTVNVQTGTLDIPSLALSTHTGDFNVAAASTLQFSGGNTNNISGDITGAGTVMFSGPTNNLTGAHTIANTTIGGGTVNFNQGGTLSLPNLTLNSGTLAGSSAINATGNVELNGGTLSGSAAFNIPAGGTAVLDNSYVTVQRPFNVAGTLTEVGTAYIYLLTGGSFTVAASGTFNIQSNDGAYTLYGGATNTVTNNGTINKTTTSGVAYLYNVGFTNGAGGDLNVQSGTLELSSTGTTTHAGAFNVAAGAILKFTGNGTNTYNGAIAGDGAVTFTTGTHTLTNYSIADTTIGGGTINFNAAGGQSLENLTMTGGTVAGSAALTITGNLDANSGIFSGNALFTIANGATAILDSSYLQFSRPFRNAGNMTFGGSAYLYFTAGSFTNQATGDIDDQNNNSYFLYGTTTTGSNAGTIRRTSSATPSTIYGMNLTNTGTISVEAGTLQIQNSTFTQTAGAFHLNGGDLQITAPGTLNIQGGVFDGNGLVDGNVAVSGTGQINPGTSPGEISITNNHTYSQATGAVYNVDVDGKVDPGIDYDRILVAGAASLGGTLNVNLGFTPAVGDSFTILQHGSRTGTFGSVTGDTPGAGRGWQLTYSATETKLSVSRMLPALMNVDSRAAAGTTSDGNGVLEPGERVVVEPTWFNVTETPIALTATASNITGPSAAGVSYTLPDANADYGTANAEATSNCFDATANCYQVQVTAPTSRPDARPATHWDATFQEAGTGGTSKTWSLHVGDSFTDVPRSQLFYRRIETLLHTGITAGCTTTEYCPTQPVNRGQMAIFVARGLAGGSANVPVSGTIAGFPYNCVAGAAGASAFTDVLPTDIFCRHVHYIAAQNVTLGCQTTPISRYCPTGNITRQEMASFIAKAVVAPAGGTAVPSFYTDPVTNLSYNCNGSDIQFTDVPASNVFCKHVHFLWARGIVSGTSPTTFRPTDLVTRDGMARFLSNAFNLLLYGPVP